MRGAGAARADGRNRKERMFTRKLALAASAVLLPVGLISTIGAGSVSASTAVTGTGA